MTAWTESTSFLAATIAAAAKMADCFGLPFQFTNSLTIHKLPHFCLNSISTPSLHLKCNGLEIRNRSQAAGFQRWLIHRHSPIAVAPVCSNTPANIALCFHISNSQQGSFIIPRSFALFFSQHWIAFLAPLFLSITVRLLEIKCLIISLHFLLYFSRV